MISSKFSNVITKYWFWLDPPRHLELTGGDCAPSVSHPPLGIAGFENDLMLWQRHKRASRYMKAHFKLLPVSHLLDTTGQSNSPD